MVSPTMFYDMVTICVSNTTTAVPMATEARTEYDRSRTVDGNKTTHFILNCSHYHTKAVDRRKSIRAQCFGENFCSNVLHREDVHMVMLIVIENMLPSCFPCSATCIAVFGTACA